LAASSSPTYIVGTPMKIVHFSFSSSSSAWAPSKRGSSTTLAPTKKAVFMQHVWPNVWNSGRQPSTTSSGPMSKLLVADDSTFIVTLRCVISAPLG
jgi:hypothetical protein